MMKCSPITRCLLVLAIIASSGVAPGAVRDVRAASGLTSVAVAEFGPSEWVVEAGSASLGTVANGGGSALQVAYDVSGSSLFIAPKGTGPEIPGAPREVQLDVSGDASWNVLYVELRDATGEVLRYWAGTADLGSLGFTGWRTVRFPIGTASNELIAHRAGDNDGVLDLPVSVYGIVVYPGSNAQKTRSTIAVDNLIVTTDPGPLLQVEPYAFAPAAGERADVATRVADAGPVAVTLSDTAGRARSISLDAPGGGGTAKVSWDGRTNGGAFLSGSVAARVSANRDARTWVYDIPYAAGIAARPAVGPSTTATGVQTFMTHIDTADRDAADRIAFLAEQAEVQYVRESFDWHQVEPRRQGTFEWAKIDQAVEVARAHRLQILARLQYSAGWASSAPASVTGSARYYYPPANVADFAAYARAMVHRYKDRVHVWEIWNEENTANLWRPAPNAAAYARLLKAAYAAIKAEDPTAVVVLGGLSTGPDQAYLQGIYDAGAWSSFDVLAIHSFVNDDPSSSLSTFPVWLDMAAQTVARWGAKPIWITEFGWSTYTGGVTEGRQASYLYQGFRVGAMRGIAGMILHELVDYGTNSGSLLHNYGLLTVGGRYKPGFDALQCSAAALARNAVPTCAIDSTRPGIGSRNPASGATGAARDTRPAVTFSEPVSGVRASTMRLRDLTASAWVTATVSYNRSTGRATLTPARLLAAGHRFRLSLSSSIADLAGNRLPATSWTFTTSRDATRPKVSGRSPSSGATGVSRTANVAAAFREPLRASTVTTSSVRLRDTSTGRYIVATVRYDAASRRAILDPSLTLDARRTYQVLVTSGIKDRAGNRAVSTSWLFKTGS